MRKLFPRVVVIVLIAGLVADAAPVDAWNGLASRRAPSYSVRRPLFAADAINARLAVAFAGALQSVKHIPLLLTFAAPSSFTKGEPSTSGASWLPWRWYRRYFAGLEQDLLLGASGWLAGGLTSSFFTAPESLVATIAVTMLSAFSVAVFAVRAFRHIHWLNRRNFHTPEIYVISLETALAGWFLGAAAALPMSYTRMSVFLWSVAGILSFLVTRQHYRYHRPPPSRRFLYNAIASVLILLGVAGALGPALDQKIRHYRRSENTYDQLQSIGMGVILPSPESSAQLWEDFFDRLARLRRTFVPVAEGRELAGELYSSLRHLAWSDAPIPPERISELTEFVEESETSTVASYAARENLADAKTLVLRMLGASAAVGPAVTIELLSRLLSHEETVSRPDATFPPFGFSESDVLTQRLRFAAQLQLSRLALDKTGDPLLRERAGMALAGHDLIPILNDVSRDDVSPMLKALDTWIDPNVSFGENETLQDELQKARDETLHPISLRVAEATREIRAWPLALVRAIQKSAARHFLPPELLGANLIEVTEHDYSIEEGVSIILERLYHRDARQAADDNPFHRLDSFLDHPASPLARRARFLLQRLGDRKIPAYINDFVAGVFLRTHNGIGVYQIRPETARHADGSVEIRFKDLGRKNEFLISWGLHDTSYNVEVWAAAFEKALSEVDDVRQRVRRGEKVNLATWARESTFQMTALHLTPELYALLPPLNRLAEAARWRLARFHPQYATRVRAWEPIQLVVRRSGIFDSAGKKVPAIFVGIDSEEQMAVLATYLGDRDSFFRSTARRTLEQLASRPGPFQVKARKILGVHVGARVKPSNAIPALFQPSGLRAA